MTRVRILGRVRTRLLAAFLLLLGAAVLLTAMGWVGLRRMQGALADVEEDLLPRIFQALELSERATLFASAAPKLGDSLSRQELDAQRALLEAQLARIAGNARELREPTPQLQRVVTRLEVGMQQNLPALVQRAQHKLVLQGQLDADLARLDRLGQTLHAARPDATAVDPRISSLWSTLVLGAAVTDAATIGRLEADAEALLLSARRRKTLAELAPEQARDLVELTEGPNSLLACRHALINLDAQVNYLVALTSADASNLSDETSRYVAQLRQAGAERSVRVRAETHSGELFMLALTALCIAIALGAARYVRRLVGEIGTITLLMSRLAEGDTAQATPATARPDELGELARSFEIFRDNLLAKQQLVRDLHAQRELLEAVHHNLTDGLAVFDPNGRLLLWNARLDEMLGRQHVKPRAGSTPQALLAAFPPGTTWSETAHARARPLADLPPLAWVQADHLELHAPDGQALDLRSCAMPGGGTVTLVTDLSAPRAIERQLQQAQKLEVLGQLTGGVAHDFNNYLGTILGNLALLEASVSDDSRALVQWQRVRRAATSAAGLTRRLLAFARRQPLQAEDVPLDEMVQEMRDLIEYSAGDAVVLQLALGADPTPAHVDRGQLENALLNLVMNSAAAMPRGGRLTVATSVVADPDGRRSVELSVEDTGIGMNETQAAKAFEPFFSTRPVGEGSGLGLSIVYGFVRQSGGDVTLQSRPGIGTRVAMRFPAVPEALQQVAVAPPPMAALEPLRDCALLLVEDDDAFRETLSEQLRQLGVVVHAVADAEAAVAALAGGVVVQAVLSDIRLGSGANGLAFARIVQARRPGLPVLLMSGEVPEFASGAGAEAGGERRDSDPQFLQKPFALAQLLAWLQSHQASTWTP